MAKNQARAQREAAGQGGSRHTSETGKRGISKPKDAKAEALTRKEIAKLEALERELAAIPAKPRAKVTSIKTRQKIDVKQKGKPNWTMGQARKLVMDGYTVEHVSQYTGWGRYWLEDLES